MDFSNFINEFHTIITVFEKSIQIQNEQICSLTNMNNQLINKINLLENNLFAFYQIKEDVHKVKNDVFTIKEALVEKKTEMFNEVTQTHYNILQIKKEEMFSLEGNINENSLFSGKNSKLGSSSFYFNQLEELKKETCREVQFLTDVIEFNKNFNPDKSYNNEEIENYLKWWTVLLYYSNIKVYLKKYKASIKFSVFFHFIFKGKKGRVNELLGILEKLKNEFNNDSEFDIHALMKKELDDFFTNNKDILFKLKKNKESHEYKFVFQNLKFVLILFKDITDLNNKTPIQITKKEHVYVERFFKLKNKNEYDRRQLIELITAISIPNKKEHLVIEPEKCFGIYLFYFLIKRNNLLKDETKKLEISKYDRIINLIEFTLFGGCSNLRTVHLPHNFDVDPLEYISDKKDEYYFLCFILYFSQNLKIIKTKEKELANGQLKFVKTGINILRYLDLIPFEELENTKDLNIIGDLILLLNGIFNQESLFYSNFGNSEEWNFNIQFLEKLFIFSWSTTLMVDLKIIEALTEWIKNYTTVDLDVGILFLIFGHSIQKLPSITLENIFTYKPIYAIKNLNYFWEFSRAYFLISYWLDQCEQKCYHANKYNRILYLATSKLIHPTNIENSTKMNETFVNYSSSGCLENYRNSTGFQDTLTKLNLHSKILYIEEKDDSKLQNLHYNFSTYYCIIIGPLTDPSNYYQSQLKELTLSFNVQPILIYSEKEDNAFTISNLSQKNKQEEDESIKEKYLLFINPKRRENIYNAIQSFLKFSTNSNIFKSKLTQPSKFISLLNKPPEISYLMNKMLENLK